MNVGELIEKLKELNPNLPVYFGVSDTWFWSADCLEVCDPDNFGEDVCLIYHQVKEMNVGELIEELKKYESDMEVKYFYLDSFGRIVGETITDIEIWCPDETDNYDEFVLIS